MHKRSPTTPSGLTLVEMLVVISLIILLIGLLIVAVTKSIGVAERSRLEQMMGRVGVALQTYNVDHKDFPPSNPGRFSGGVFGMSSGAITDWTGAHLLCQALTGSSAADNKKGLGWKKASVGRTYGPYYMPDGDEVRKTTDPTGYVLADTWGGTLMYYRAIVTANQQPVWGNRFDKDDNADSDKINPNQHDAVALRASKYLLGSTAGSSNPDDSVVYLGN